MAATTQRLQASIRDAATTSPDGSAFRLRVLEAIRAQIGFDAACLGVTDPATSGPVALTTLGWDDPAIYATVADIEFGSGEEPGRLESLRGLAVPVRTLREATGGRVGRSRIYADVLAPYGLRDEVRMVFRGHDGRYWGACTLARSDGPKFTDDEVAALGAVLADVGDGLRTVLFRDSTRTLPAAPKGPAVAIIGADSQFETATPAALDYFARLGWEPAGRLAATTPAVMTAAWLRHSHQDSVVVRTRTRDGEWVVIRAGWYDDERPHRRVVLTVERAQLPEIASLAGICYGLTPRELEVFAHLLAGESRNEIARTLCISPYTVQDHLKSIYAKTGVSSRRGLVALLVHSEYLPRLGSPVGADGWFAGTTVA